MCVLSWDLKVLKLSASRTVRGSGFQIAGATCKCAWKCTTNVCSCRSVGVRWWPRSREREPHYRRQLEIAPFLRRTMTDFTWRKKSPGGESWLSGLPRASCLAHVGREFLKVLDRKFRQSLRPTLIETVFLFRGSATGSASLIHISMLLSCCRVKLVQWWIFDHWWSC